MYKLSETSYAFVNKELAEVEIEAKEDKKYILTNQKRNVMGKTLYRIKAIKDFDDVKAGDLGGWIESEANLSQEGNA